MPSDKYKKSKMFLILFISSWLLILGGIGGGVAYYSMSPSNPEIWMALILLTAIGGIIRYYAGRAFYN